MILSKYVVSPPSHIDVGRENVCHVGRLEESTARKGEDGEHAVAQQHHWHCVHGDLHNPAVILTQREKQREGGLKGKTICTIAHKSVEGEGVWPANEGLPFDGKVRRAATRTRVTIRERVTRAPRHTVVVRRPSTLSRCIYNFWRIILKAYPSRARQSRPDTNSTNDDISYGGNRKLNRTPFSTS